MTGIQKIVCALGALAVFALAVYHGNSGGMAFGAVAFILVVTQ